MCVDYEEARQRDGCLNIYIVGPKSSHKRTCKPKPRQTFYPHRKPTCSEDLKGSFWFVPLWARDPTIWSDMMREQRSWYHGLQRTQDLWRDDEAQLPSIVFCTTAFCIRYSGPTTIHFQHFGKQGTHARAPYPHSDGNTLKPLQVLYTEGGRHMRQISFGRQTLASVTYRTWVILRTLWWPIPRPHDREK